MGLNQADFAVLGGVKISSQTRYEAGTGSPDISYLSAIAEHGADVVFILTGQRSDELLTEEESSIVTALRRLEPHQRAAVFALLQSLNLGD